MMDFKVPSGTSSFMRCGFTVTIRTIPATSPLNC